MDTDFKKLVLVTYILLVPFDSALQNSSKLESLRKNAFGNSYWALLKGMIGIQCQCIDNIFNTINERFPFEKTLKTGEIINVPCPSNLRKVFEYIKKKDLISTIKHASGEDGALKALEWILDDFPEREPWIKTTGN